MFRIAFCKDSLVKTHTEAIFWNIYSKIRNILNGRGKISPADIDLLGRKV